MNVIMITPLVHERGHNHASPPSKLHEDATFSHRFSKQTVCFSQNLIISSHRIQNCASSMTALLGFVHIEVALMSKIAPSLLGKWAEVPILSCAAVAELEM